MEKTNIRGRDLILHFGKLVVGNEFNLNDPFREKTYRNVYLYFAGNKQTCYNLDSSLMIAGSLGVGKSVLMKVMQRIFPYQFYRLEALKLKKMVIDNGSTDTLENFGYHFKKNLFIDDLGTEDPAMKMWGTQPNIMMDLVFERYDLFCDSNHQYKTHIVCNLTPEDIKNYYTDKVLDRMFEICKKNIITWEGESLRTTWN